MQLNTSALEALIREAGLLVEPQLAIIKRLAPGKICKVKGDGGKFTIYRNKAGEIHLLEPFKQAAVTADNFAAVQLEEARAIAEELRPTHRYLTQGDRSHVVQVGAYNVLLPLDVQQFEHELVSRSLGRYTRNQASEIARCVHTIMRTEMRDAFVLDGLSVAPLLWSNESLSSYCWGRLQVPQEVRTEPPEAFAELLERCHSPAQAEALAQWIGSLLDADSARDQYLYLQGDGNDGKSALCFALNQLMGSSAIQIRAATLNNTHSGTVLEGKRLMVLQDENAASFPSSGMFKTITGDDYMTVNPKFNQLYNIRLICKCLITSNNEPTLKGGKADERRLVYVRLKTYEGTDLTYKLRLASQAGEMMQYCWTKYSEWKTAHPKGGTMGDTQIIADIMSTSTVAQAADLFAKLFVIDPAGKIPSADFRTIVNRAERDKNLAAEVFAYAKRIAEYKKLWLNGRSVNGFEGIAPTPLEVG